MGPLNAWDLLGPNQGPVEVLKTKDSGFGRSVVVWWRHLLVK